MAKVRGRVVIGVLESAEMTGKVVKMAAVWEWCGHWSMRMRKMQEGRCGRRREMR